MKTILLLTHHLENFAGSEINIYELANTFVKLGYSVEIGTFSYGNPIKTIFQENNLNVKNLLDETLDLNCYDLIWAQHSPVLNYVLFELNLNYKHLVYSSLSPYEPLEVPPVYLNAYISIFIANSKETKNKMIAEGAPEDKITILKNSVTENFFQYKKKEPLNEIESIAVISNHVPKELYDLQEIFVKHNKEFVFYGIGNREEFITPEVLSKYDAIITIGKTVQFSLAIGIPVYVYDRFGGDGWVTIENINFLEEYNFSGRYEGFKYTGKELFHNVMNGYPKAVEDVEMLRAIANERYSLEKNLENVLLLLSKERTKIDKSQFRYMHRTLQCYTRLLKNFHQLQSDYTKLLNENKQQLKEKEQQLKEKEQHIQQKELEIQKLIADNLELGELANSMRIKNRIKNLFKFGKK